MAQQPDLNWDNDDVRKAIYQEAVIFWLERGVDGFRVDSEGRHLAFFSAFIDFAALHSESQIFKTSFRRCGSYFAA